MKDLSVYMSLERKSFQFLLLFLICFTISTDVVFSSSGLREESKQVTNQTGTMVLSEEEARKTLQPFLEFCTGFDHLANNEDREAYNVFKKLRDQGLKGLESTLNNMNLFDLILTDDVLIHVALLLEMKDFARFQCVSKRTCWTTKTPRLMNGYDLDEILRKMTISPQPQEIKMLRRPRVEKGSIKVHFRDSEHLRAISRKYPLIDSKDRVYFVKDKMARGGKEFFATDGELQWDYYMHVVANGPVKISYPNALPCPISLPHGSHLTLDATYKNGVYCKAFGVRSKSNLYPFTIELIGSALTLDKGIINKLFDYTQKRCYLQGHYHKGAHDLANLVESFTERHYNQATKQAKEVIRKRKAERLHNYVKFPAFNELCPGTLVFSDQTSTIVEKDYLESDSPFAYVAKSIEEINLLYKYNPDFQHSIAYINADLKQSGFYSHSDFKMRSGFEIDSKGSLCIAGNLPIHDYNLKISAKNDLWLFCNVTAHNVFLAGNPTRVLTSLPGKKPDAMPEVIWQKLQLFFKEVYKPSHW